MTVHTEVRPFLCNHCGNAFMCIRIQEKFIHVINKTRNAIKCLYKIVILHLMARSPHLGLFYYPTQGDYYSCNQCTIQVIDVTHTGGTIIHVFDIININTQCHRTPVSIKTHTGELFMQSMYDSSNQ